MTDGKKNDLTRIEDLGEFLHQDDPETDRALLSEPLMPPDELPSAETTDLSSLDDLPSDDSAALEVSEEPVQADLSPDAPAEDTGLDLSMDESVSVESEAEVQAEVFDAPEESLEEPAADFATSEQSITLSDDAPLEEAPFEAPLDAPPSADEPALEAGAEMDLGQETIAEQPFDQQQPEVDPFASSAIEEGPDLAPLDATVPDFGEQDVAMDSADSAPEETTFAPTTQVTARAITPLERPSAPPTPPPREDFQDVKKFGNAMVTTGAIKAGGNPPFAVMINRIQYQQDADELLQILEEVGLAQGDLQKDIKQGISTGALLLGQLSEYSAIYLAHRIRHLDLDVRVGLGEQIHQSKYYDAEYRGLVERENLAQNKEMKAKLKERPITPQEILLSTTPTVEGHEIKQYLNIIRESVVLSESALEERAKAAKTTPPSGKKNYQLEGDINVQWAGHIDDIYDDLTQSLRLKAYAMGGNAIIGLSFGLTPLIVDQRSHYRIVAFGNVVTLGPARGGKQETRHHV